MSPHQIHDKKSICVCALFLATDNQIVTMNTGKNTAAVGSGWEGNLDRNALYTYNRQLGLWRISPDSFPATEGVLVSPWPNSVVSPMVKMGFTWLVWFIGPIVTNGH